jgi:hypothetical protein
MIQIKDPNGNNISFKTMAALLGISTIEYAQLKHSSIMSIESSNRKTVRYFILIDYDNPRHIIDKLKMNDLRMVYLQIDTLGDPHKNDND